MIITASSKKLQKWSCKFTAKSWFKWKKQNVIKHKNLVSHIKMGKSILTFSDTEIKKHKFYCYKSPDFLEDVDVDNVLVSDKISSCEKNYTLLVTWMMIIKISH